MKVVRFFLVGALINLILFAITHFLPFNPLQLLIANLVTLFVFLFGINAKIISTGIPIVASTYNGITLRIAVSQTFYELLTIIALTIPLYLKNWKRMIEKTLTVIGIMLGYYLFIYGFAIITFLKNHSNLLTRFLSFNTESFMIFAFLLVWFLVNWKEIEKYTKS
ncbi:hypothetical protein JXA85_03150 [Candidatus Woesearchaeota archaeon]|nr:hypothetical protein [Candidatus Woesearchaeota archaeon]